MKHLIFFFLFFSFSLSAQKIDRWGPIPYSKQAPTKTPKVTDSQVWFNNTTSTFSIYDRTNAEWDDLQTVGIAYGEMSISNDTTTLSFAATTALPVEELTVGLIDGFTMLLDSALRWDGATAKFLLHYHATVSFAEAANILNAYPVIGTTPVYRARSRQTATLVADRVNLSGSSLITLTQGQTVRLMFVPSTHTGTDALTIYECGLSLTQLK